ncbi:MAG: tagaturonate epimerase family protein, partial [Treponema sp.]|nr:tagaturonate epimerase family protein [Treponema sp.]
MTYLGFDAYEKSINEIGEGVVFLAKAAAKTGAGGEDFIVARGLPGFQGEELGGGLIKAPLNHANAETLRKLLPFTAPSRVLTKDRSFGVGDRLGIAVLGHIRIFEQY